MSIKACGSLAFNPTTTTNTDQLTPAEKQCYCTLATNTAWAQPCSTADSCGADFASLLGQGFAAGKDQACQGVNISGNSNSASSIKATAGVALALAAGFTQALL
ncbi:hypothetical protein BGZ54_004405 [Gamsiella multidivaricata]|nr:hypothetical protein BGZ54_004405 [Gamsiella multidivaricata]